MWIVTFEQIRMSNPFYSTNNLNCSPRKHGEYQSIVTLVCDKVLVCMEIQKRLLDKQLLHLFLFAFQMQTKF